MEPSRVFCGTATIDTIHSVVQGDHSSKPVWFASWLVSFFSGFKHAVEFPSQLQFSFTSTD